MKNLLSLKSLVFQRQQGLCMSQQGSSLGKSVLQESGVCPQGTLVIPKLLQITFVRVDFSCRFCRLT